MKIAVLLIAFCGTAIGQLSYGLIGGVPFTDLTKGTSGLVDKSGQFTLGPTLQIGLPLGLRVEADALYRGAGLQVNSVFSVQKYSASQWRFPVMVQYRFPGLVIRPFVGAGYSYDHVNIKAVSPYSVTSHHGFVMGAGVDVKIPLIRISPEIRYTRDLDPGTGKALQLNQAEFLIGVRF